MESDVELANKRVSWIRVAITIILGLLIYLRVLWMINPKLGAYLTLPNRMVGDAMMFLIPLVVTSLVAIGTAKIVPKYRKIPISNLVDKAFWICAAFAALLLISTWFTAQKTRQLSSNDLQSSAGVM